jgi:hypothetical protein
VRGGFGEASVSRTALSLITLQEQRIIPPDLALLQPVPVEYGFSGVSATKINSL